MYKFILFEDVIKRFIIMNNTNCIVCGNDFKNKIIHKNTCIFFMKKTRMVS